MFQLLYSCLTNKKTFCWFNWVFAFHSAKCSMLFCVCWVSFRKNNWNKNICQLFYMVSICIKHPIVSYRDCLIHINWICLLNMSDWEAFSSYFFQLQDAFFVLWFVNMILLVISEVQNLRLHILYFSVL